MYTDRQTDRQTDGKQKDKQPVRHIEWQTWGQTIDRFEGGWREQQF